MRDIVLFIGLIGSVPFILRRPTLGVFLWVWVGVMSPHRLTWGFAYDFPFAQVIAIATLLGMLYTKEPKQLPDNPMVKVLFLMMLWMSITTVFAFYPSESMDMWLKVLKIQFMLFITLYLLHTKQHVQVLMAVLAGSVAFYGIKGGIFTIKGGGEEMVLGPAGSFIEDNNDLALAVVMTIPLLYFLYLQTRKRWLQWGLLASMVLCGFSALGSQSRGALLGIGAMLVFFWLKSRSKIAIGLMLVVLVPVAYQFMPEKWHARMMTIETYEEDNSAMGRINAWKMAINLTKDRPIIGGGFEIYNGDIFGRYAPNPRDIHAAHSIYFQVLGEHGYVGLALFMLLGILVWRDSSWIVRKARGRNDLQWASDLARMIQVSMIGYAVGGAFLSLAYYDVPYNLLVVIVLTRRLVEKAPQSTAQKGWWKAKSATNQPKIGDAQPAFRNLPKPPMLANRR